MITIKAESIDLYFWHCYNHRVNLPHAAHQDTNFVVLFIAPVFYLIILVIQCSMMSFRSLPNSYAES